MLLSGFNCEATVQPWGNSHLEFPREGALGQRDGRSFAAGSHVVDYLSHKVNKTAQRFLGVRREP